MDNKNLKFLSLLLEQGVQGIREIIREEVEGVMQERLPKAKEEEIKYLTRKETAQLLGISLPTLNDWTKKGLLKSYRISSRIRYIESEVHHAMESLRKYQHH